MCGIVGSSGIINFDIVKASKLMAHRGPDSNGFYRNETIYLGHQRLSILDLSPNGHQPFISEDGNFVLVFNGEIYNYKEIRQKLNFEFNFISTSDTEVLLKGFIKYGKKIVEMLNGIFSFAIYDKQKNELFIARDPLGVKPLYYYYNENQFMFASEMKSFLAFPTFNKTLNYSTFVNYIHFLYSPGEETPFLYVKKLLPGHSITIDCNTNSISIEQYYKLTFSNVFSTASEHDLIKELDSLVYTAVKRQLVSDAPIGFFLSGGLDSSAILAMATKINSVKYKCFTIDTSSFEKNIFSDDLKYAKIVAQKLDLDLEIVPATISIIDDFDKMIYHLDEPQTDPASLNVYNICSIANKEGIKVLLGGVGGDELFSGYSRHKALSFEKYFQFMPRYLGAEIANITSKFDQRNPFLRKITKLCNGLGMSKLERLQNYYAWLPIEENKSLFSNDLQTTIKYKNPYTYFNYLDAQLPLNICDLNKMLNWELKTYLVDNNLQYTDKMSMAKGIEVRVPFLDLDLVNFSTTLPPKYKLQNNETKYLLKKVLENYLPKEVIYRPKTGFGVPLRKWILNDLNEKIREDLSEKNISNRGIFDSKSIQTLINKNQRGEIDASYTIWSLLAIESWCKQFVDTN